MIKGLWIKFLILLLSVSLIALSAAFFLRGLMIKDFKEYLEGEMEDRVYWVTADLEGRYEKHSKWKEDILVEDTVWALMLGLEIRIKDMNDNIVLDTEKALDKLSPLMKRRITAISDFKQAGSTENFIPYPLFLSGKEIGTLEVRFLKPEKEHIFIEQSNRFLLLSLLTLGGIAILLSVTLSNRLTRPLKNLASAARDISRGNLKGRVKISSNDEIGRLSETFNIMAKNLEMQESLRKKLISNMAHELRTPISAINGELEGMMDGLIPINKEQLRSLHDEIGRLKNIIEGIEELTHAQASSLTLKKQSIDINPFLKNIIERFDNLFTDKGIAVEIISDEKLIMNADPDKLSQIVINLLNNALKATEKGYVRIKTGKKDAETFIRIEDTGHGINEGNLPFIFERFYKLSEGGLGLGLAIVKELVEAHEGRIEVKSEYGKGTIFTVYLPLHNSS